MRILIVDQCSNMKDIPEAVTPLDESTIDAQSLEDLRSQKDMLTRRARKLYTGRQQQYISAAVERLRSAGDHVDRVFISAGFGVVDENEQLPPYDVSLTGRSEEAVRARAQNLSIETDLENRLATAPPYDLVFFALGRDYYSTFDLNAVVTVIPDDTMVVLFNHPDTAKQYPNVVSVPARTEQAKEQGTITVALKGRYLQHFADHRSHGANVEESEDVLQYCTTEYTSQSGLKRYSN